MFPPPNVPDFKSPRVKSHPWRFQITVGSRTRGDFRSPRVKSHPWRFQITTVGSRTRGDFKSPRVKSHPWRFQITVGSRIRGGFRSRWEVAPVVILKSPRWEVAPVVISNHHGKILISSPWSFQTTTGKWPILCLV
ncbi:hypothetical protein QUF72_12015 [Desulfobacterales bacterium HSG2]|nr:hypothetical protein [Desulfobacterales bacterium HSG2]